jgi:hypothetical protein
VDDAAILAAVNDADGSRNGRQRRRWSLLPVSHRTTRTSADAPDFDTSPIQATNGQTPTVIGRTRLMFSPAKAVIAASVVVGIWGAVLIAQPFGPAGDTAPGATTDDRAMAPSFFTGTAPTSGSCQLAIPTIEDFGGVSHKRGESWGCLTWTTDDPRFSGVSRNIWNEDQYSEGLTRGSSPRMATDRVGSIKAGRERIENDAGAWEGTWTDLAVESFDEVSGWFVGEGAYEGLTAYVVITDAQGGAKVWGVIMPDGPLTPPDALPGE